ncbi:DDE-type integrase/transposase/recombinase [Pseudodesulfovibrio senegalensis]|uniref:Transposase n=1 Tax=Pseudodesulfovibrio senegalensis TaxID=1721087 RepID=A0A6N6N4A0_9BACT|nr:DDE-type integrase/transposase/recombinase [Pseudodesulfovibrio senegalensis]KAB1442884.1 transposase [Pseudodesulfovibrio senegalensis]
MFKINEVLSYDGKQFRVLSLLGEQLVWIDINDSRAFPTLVFTQDLQLAIENETLTRTEDPFADQAFASPEPGSANQTRRDKNYGIIRNIIEDPEFHDAKIRAARIKTVLATQKISKPHVYKLLRRYWQRGQTPNALLPDYKNSGAKGKKRNANKNKLGRPREHTPGVGAIIDEQTERLFRIAIDRHLLKDRGCSFPYAHRRFKTLYENYFPDIPESEMPTIRQMRYFYEREYGLVKKLKKRTPKIEYNKDVRQLTSTANANTLGPGSRYEIDATIADIYLVSDSDRRDIVGRPVIYFVKDVFSRMIAGLYVGFENPSYAAAIQSLSVAMTDKVQFCKEYGFDISDEDWPTVGLPDAILADRGELLGHQIESLESCFSVRIENTPPYRGDAKGIVERSFKTIQAEFKPFAPGVVGKTLVKKRGGKDYRLDAKLSVTEFKKIIISSVLTHNRFDVLDKYDREPDMPPDLPMTPLSIWNWGIQHRTGRLRNAPEEAIRISLLPRTKATISDLGLSVFGVYYTSPEIIEHGWLHRAKEVRRPVGLTTAYDPASADTVYLFPTKETGEYWPCRLTPRSREFAGASFWDVWRTKKEQKKAVAKSRLQKEAEQRKHEEFVAETIRQAEKRSPHTSDAPDAERIRGIRPNKETEKQKERHPLNAPAKQISAPAGKTIPFKGVEQESYEYPDFIDELFGDEDT